VATIQPITTNWTTTSCLKLLNTTYDVGNLGPFLEQAQICVCITSSW